MNVGIIGTGNIGGTLAGRLAAVGHRVCVAGRDRAKARATAVRIGRDATDATPAEAARLAEVLIVAVPLRELPGLAAKIGEPAAGKIVVDTSNPYPARDGAVAEESVRAGDGTGSWTQRLLPASRVVKCFNTLYYETLAAAGDRASPTIAVPIASDDASAAAAIAGLVVELGFAPLVMPTLADSRRFDAGTAAYGRPLSPEELALALASA